MIIRIFLPIDMLKAIIIYFLTFISIESYGQSVERRNSGRWIDNEWKINWYSDSLNFWDGKLPLPRFLEDPELDWQQSFGDCSINLEGNSFRKAVLDRVLNINTLNAIIISGNRKFDMYYDPVVMRKRERRSKPSLNKNSFPKFQYMQYSIRQLAKMRVEELSEGRIRGKATDAKGCWTRIDREINVTADSLNWWIPGTNLPSFLSDPLFDWRKKELGKDCISDKIFISYRKMVFDRVIDSKVLSVIINVNDSLLDKRYGLIVMENSNPGNSNFPELPYMKFSTRDLAKRRLIELNSRER